MQGVFFIKQNGDVSIYIFFIHGRLMFKFILLFNSMIHIIAIYSSII